MKRLKLSIAMMMFCLCVTYVCPTAVHGTEPQEEQKIAVDDSEDHSSETEDRDEREDDITAESNTVRPKSSDLPNDGF